MTQEDISFAELLESNADGFERPPVLPAGYYLAMVGTHRFDKSAVKKTPFVEFETVLQEPCEGIAAADLEGLEVQGRKLRIPFYLTGKAAWRLTEFMQKCGINVEGRTYNETIPETKDCLIRVYLAQRPGRDPGSDDMFNEITATAEAE
jgi:hypothetical protein